MGKDDYLSWVTRNTNTTWWHDSADPEELAFALNHGATGVTSNPVLSYRSLLANKEQWSAEIKRIDTKQGDGERRAESLMGMVLSHICETLKPKFEESKGEWGYVCAQVNPARAGDRGAMLDMARRFQAWAPNIAVKLPVTAAGLDVLEECAAEGITVTATVSFTVPQAVAIAERYRKGLHRAKRNGVRSGKCFAVIMIGRLDDYIRDAALDYKADLTEAEITQAGLAVTKRSYDIYRRSGYEATLLVAALRGTYHMSELAGANLVMSIAPKYQKLLLSTDVPREERLENEIPKKVIDRLSKLPEFVKSYEPSGMKPEDFITFGATQRTLSQFYEIGWSQLEGFSI
jgi:transaldolase